MSSYSFWKSLFYIIIAGCGVFTIAYFLDIPMQYAPKNTPAPKAIPTNSVVDSQATNTGTEQSNPKPCDRSDTLTVCGIDGRDYANECFARAQGVEIAYLGHCSQADTGSTTESPRGCSRDYNPVCSVEGEDFANACLAESANAVIAFNGPCSEAPADAIKKTTPPSAEANCSENAPVCGADGKNYNNACLAKSAGTTVASVGKCTSGTGVVAITGTGSGSESETESASSESNDQYSNTGSYQVYENSGVGYQFSMPKYSYYQGHGARDGATHTMAVGLSGTGVADFSIADVRVYFYKKIPLSPPSSTSIPTENGILYIDSNTNNPKINQIVETIKASVK